MVNSSIKEIRDVCRQIASTYVRGKEFLVTSLELGQGQRDKENKGKGKVKQAQYSERNVEH